MQMKNETHTFEGSRAMNEVITSMFGTGKVADNKTTAANIIAGLGAGWYAKGHDTDIVLTNPQRADVKVTIGQGAVRIYRQGFGVTIYRPQNDGMFDIDAIVARTLVSTV